MRGSPGPDHRHQGVGAGLQPGRGVGGDRLLIAGPDQDRVGETGRDELVAGDIVDHQGDRGRQADLPLAGEPQRDGRAAVEILADGQPRLGADLIDGEVRARLGGVFAPKVDRPVQRVFRPGRERQGSRGPETLSLAGQDRGGLGELDIRHRVAVRILDRRGAEAPDVDVSGVGQFPPDADPASGSRIGARRPSVALRS